MLQPVCSKYMTPTTHSRRLAVLMAIHGEPRTSQHQIAGCCSLSSSMVNNYIKCLKKEGLISVKGETNRTQSYYLTEDGHNELRESLLTYSTEVVQLYISVKREISGILRKYYRKGIRTLVLFGVADTAEIVSAAVQNTALIVIGVVDSNPEKQGKTFNGLIIRDPSELQEINPDAVLITSFAKQAEICERVNMLAGNEIEIIKLSETI